MGPTNTGKTHLAISLAEKLKAEIISVDSVQVYNCLLYTSPSPRDRG